MLRDLCAFMGGAKVNNEMDVREVKRKFFVPEDRNKEHELRFEVMPDGSFTETHDWISNESAARSAVNAIANQAGIASWFIDEYTAVGN